MLGNVLEKAEVLQCSLYCLGVDGRTAKKRYGGGRKGIIIQHHSQRVGGVGAVRLTDPTSVGSVKSGIRLSLPPFGPSMGCRRAGDRRNEY